MHPSRIALSLRLIHPQLSSNELNKKVGLVPKRHWDVGDVRTDGKGNPLAGRNPESYCTYALVSWTRGDLEEELTRAVSLLTPKMKALNELASSGGTNEIFVGLIFKSNTGHTLPWQLLAELGKLTLNVALDIYTDDNMEWNSTDQTVKLS
jgi:hypothetical protein